ncbi:MAG: SIS domain-containing protein [Coprobacillus sp.]
MFKEYTTSIHQLIDEFSQTQENNLKEIAKIIVNKIKNGGKFYAVGTGHSHMVGEEFYARAGGLACVQLIAPMELTLGEHPLKSTQIERIEDYAKVILMQYKVKAGDVLLICSNSGRNGMPVELANECRKQSITTIAFTNIKHSSSVTSRHHSGKNLYEVCDYVIDNCGEIGDAFMDVEGVKGKMGSSSSLIGMFMAQSLSMMIAHELHLQGIVPPVFISANVDEGDNWNQKIMEEYYHI